MAQYYNCAPGEVMQAALPAFFKVDEDEEGPFTISDGSLAHWRWVGRKSDEGQISAAFEKLTRATKQSEALLAYFQLALSWPEQTEDFIPGSRKRPSWTKGWIQPTSEACRRRAF